MRLDVPAAARPEPRTDVDVPFPEARGAAAAAWTLELPFRTPLSLNDRMHWRVKAEHVKPWREAALVLARHQHIPPCQRIEVALFYTPVDNRARDPLNLVASLKPLEDGLVDAGVIPDDSAKYHTSVMPVITEKGPLRPGRNRLWLVVTRLA